MSQSVSHGIDPATGKMVALKVAADGTLVTSGGGGGGGGSSDTTEATQLNVLAEVTSIDAKTPTLTGGRVPVEPLGVPGVARQVSATSSNTNTVLTVGVARISIHCRGANCRYLVGTSAQTANATTSHFVADGERIDIDVPATPNIAFIRDLAATSNGSIEITELS
jgi:hypothetical protein